MFTESSLNIGFCVRYWMILISLWPMLRFFMFAYIILFHTWSNTLLKSVANAHQWRGHGSHVDIFVNTSYIQVFSVSSRTTWYVEIWASLQLVEIWVFVRCLMQWENQQLGRHSILRSRYCEHFVPKVTVQGSVIFCYLLSLSLLFLLLL